MYNEPDKGDEEDETGQTLKLRNEFRKVVQFRLQRRVCITRP
jgi:hypothetical protein